MYHVNYHLAGLLNAFANEKLNISNKYSFDLPPIQSETEWNKLIKDFLDNAEKFSNVIEQMDDSIFDQPYIDEKYRTYLRNIECVIEQSYYHLGQISLVNKIINAATTLLRSNYFSKFFK